VGQGDVGLDLQGRRPRAEARRRARAAGLHPGGRELPVQSLEHLQEPLGPKAGLGGQGGVRVGRLASADVASKPPPPALVTEAQPGSLLGEPGQREPTGAAGPGLGKADELVEQADVDQAAAGDETPEQPRGLVVAGGGQAAVDDGVEFRRGMGPKQAAPLRRRHDARTRPAGGRSEGNRRTVLHAGRGKGREGEIAGSQAAAVPVRRYSHCHLRAAPAVPNHGTACRLPRTPGMVVGNTGGRAPLTLP
jgi:hypothetical protein